MCQRGTDALYTFSSWIHAVKQLILTLQITFTWLSLFCCYSKEVLPRPKSLAQLIDSAARSDPSVTAAPCKDPSGCASSATSASEPAAGFALARKVSTFARRLLSQLSPSDVFFDQSSLADDLSASNSLAQADTNVDTMIADSSIVGGLRSPQTPSLLDEGSGMIWASKGVAPIIR